MSISHEGSFNGHISPYAVEQTGDVFSCHEVFVDFNGKTFLPQLAVSIGHNGYDMQQRREGSSLSQYRDDGVPNLPLAQFECT